jgi:hypothetical protein
MPVMEAEAWVGSLGEGHILMKIRHFHLQPNFVRRVVVDRNMVQAPVGREE